MKRALLVIFSIAFPLACAFAGMVLILLSNPEVSIDEGWRLGWLGLASGLAIGGAAVWVFWRRRHRRFK